MIFYNYKTKPCKERGVALTEFAIGFPVLLLFVFILVDTGILLFRLSILVDSTASFTRALTVSIGQAQAFGPQSCGSFSTIINDTYNNLNSAAPTLYAKTSFDIASNYDGTKQTLDMPSINLQPYQLLSVTGTITFDCVLCRFYDHPTLTHTSTLAIERESPCTGYSTSEITHHINAPS